MTDLPPRTTPPRAEDRTVSGIGRSQTGMWIVVAVLAIAILLAVVFSINRADTVTTTEPVATEPAEIDPATSPVEPAGDDAGTDAGTGTAPANESDDTSP